MTRRLLPNPGTAYETSWGEHVVFIEEGMSPGTWTCHPVGEPNYHCLYWADQLKMVCGETSEERS